MPLFEFKILLAYLSLEQRREEPGVLTPTLGGADGVEAHGVDAEGRRLEAQARVALPRHR